MKRAIMMVAAACTATLLASFDADAKRLGGGRSVGSSRDVATQRQMTPPPQNAAPTAGAAAAPAAAAMPAAAAAKAAAPAAAAATGWRRFMGPIAGIAAGLGIAALMSHLGLSEAFGNFLLIALAIVAGIVIVRLILSRRKASQQPSTQGLQYANATAGASGSASGSASGPFSNAGSAGSAGVGSVGNTGFGGSRPVLGSPGAMAGAGAAAVGASAAGAMTGSGGDRPYPPGFDPEPFLQQAKVNFGELQSAYDSGDTELLRDVMTPEMFAEVSGDLAARGTHAATGIIRLDAEILEVVTDDSFHWATVRFHGLTREDGVEAPQAFDEAWNLRKAVDGSTGWLLAGIQQLQ